MITAEPATYVNSLNSSSRGARWGNAARSQLGNGCHNNKYNFDNIHRDSDRNSNSSSSTSNNSNNSKSNTN